MTRDEWLKQAEDYFKKESQASEDGNESLADYYHSSGMASLTAADYAPIKDDQS